MTQGKQKFVREMFDDISDKYDFLNTVLSFGQDNRWRTKAAAEMPSSGLILDLCAGGGEMARLLFARSDFAGEIIITDMSRPMLSLAPSNIDDRYQERYQIVVCDAEKLPFKDNIFTGAMSAFCLRNLADLKAFSSESNRALQAGGQVRHLEIAHPRSHLLETTFNFYFYKLSPLIARIFTAKAYAYKYLPNSLKIFPPQEKVLETLNIGWARASFRNLMGGIAAIYKFEK